ncbi:MAG TPA: ROK family protein [Vicinamibacterales bacterium]|nr:ROK family protein [Vicinamibacterales bacterium]
MSIVAGIDLGGTAVNYTLLDSARGQFLINGLCEHPALVTQGPEVTLQQIADGLAMAAGRAGVDPAAIAAIGLDTPGPASAVGVLSAKGSTNFAHPAWAGFDLRGQLEARLGRSVTYLNDGNAAALWGHTAVFGSDGGSSISVIIGTGTGGGIVVDGRLVTGRNGFGGEVGHVLIPWRSIAGLEDLAPPCNCGRTGDLESLCSLTGIRQTLLPYFLARYPGHPLHGVEPARAATRVRSLADEGDAMSRDIFRAQARALALFLDQMVNLFDPDGFLIGGGALEASPGFRRWFLDEVRVGMPAQRAEQEPRIELMPDGDTAGARGAALEATRVFGLRAARA